mmetsp:Transcript_14935/g.34037  ORF Transcript_14935/g.34037 Transcript_14935/m.34037 type:complete len:357 (-) Transcript_14935:82-1152(-)
MDVFDCRHHDEVINYDDMHNQYANDYQEHKDRVNESPGNAGGPEANAANDPLLAPHLVNARWHELALMSSPALKEFAASAEWASLGCYCGPARALQLLDLRKKAYPFDFMRSDVKGVIHLLQTRFVDFFNTSGPPQPGAVPGELCYSTTWGGSFWHHDITQPKVREQFTRRCERLLGKDKSIPVKKTRVFVHVVNGSLGVPLVHELHRALQQALPKCRVYLLTLIDGQAGEEADRIHYTKHPTVLFYKIPKDLWTLGNFEGLNTLADAYTHGIAHAIRIWSGVEKARELPNLRSVADSLIPFYATNPAHHLYNILEGQPEFASYSQAMQPVVHKAYVEEDEEIMDDGNCASGCTVS